MNKPRVSIIMPKSSAKRVFHPDDVEFLKSFADINPLQELPDSIDEDKAKGLIKNCQACITSWGTPPLSEDILKYAPDLKLIAHAAGSVKPVVTEVVWKRNIKVTSAAAVIAINVAETTVGLMIVSLKRIFQFSEITRRGLWKDEKEYFKAKDLYKLNIGIIGAGHVGRNVIRLLKNFDVSILLYDPYVSEEEALKLGVKKVTLNELMSSSDVVSLHAPSLPETRHMINKDNLKLLKDGAVFINTARGALVDEKALIEELKTGRISACIDVTDPEPPSKDNPLRKLPNVILTPHIAGVTPNGARRVGRCAIDEVHNLFSNKPLNYEVRREMLGRIA